MDRNKAIAMLFLASASVAVAIAILVLQPQPAVAPAPTPAPTPELTPTPVIGIALVSENEAFSKAVEERAASGYEVAVEKSEADVTLMYMPEPLEVAEQEGKRVIFTDKPHIVVEGVSGAVLPRADTVAAAWDALYGYPTHSAPIRLLTLVNSDGGEAYGIFNEMLRDGKLQDKGLYIAEISELTPAEWTAQALEGIPVGLLDTIFAEDAALAVAACEALRAGGRNDSVEVICPELTVELVELMIEDHWTMGAAVGASPAEAAEAMLELAEGMVENGEEATVILEPRVIYSDDVKALADRGMEGAEEIMEELLG